MVILQHPKNYANVQQHIKAKNQPGTRVPYQSKLNLENIPDKHFSPKEYMERNRKKNCHGHVRTTVNQNPPAPLLHFWPWDNSTAFLNYLNYF